MTTTLPPPNPSTTTSSSHHHDHHHHHHSPLPTRVHTAGVGGDGLHPHFEMTVHCLAAEPRETILRIGVQDLTYSPSLHNETDARSATHSHDCAYEACVLEALRPGYRSLPLRSRSGCLIDMCCLYVHVSIKDVDLAQPAASVYSSDMEA